MEECEECGVFSDEVVFGGLGFFDLQDEIGSAPDFGGGVRNLAAGVAV